MSNRIYVQRYGAEPDVEIEPDESIVFERNGARVRVYFDPEGELKLSADERVIITPEASNVFTVRTADRMAQLAARRVRKALGNLDTGDVNLSADIRSLVEAALR